MSHTLKAKDQISRYRVVGPIGSGGMGEVYEAQDQDLERNVALKVLPRDLVQNEERVKRFVREAKSASSLSHPHIVTIYEIGQDQVHSAEVTEGSDSNPASDSQPIHFISMELVSGKTLTDKIHEEKTDLRTLLGYLAQAADGLAKAHGAGIIHRDLKPSNIMVTSDGYAKVLDFGLAKLTEKQGSFDGPEEGGTLAATQADPTSHGMVMGTVGYMAPEQVAGKPVDARADIFAFGCILYEAATRHRAFSEATGVETMHKILHEQPAPLENLTPDVPGALRRLIRRTLAKDPDQRLQSMKDLAIELKEIVEEYDTLTPASSESTGAFAPLPAPRRSTASWVGIGAAVAFGLAGLTFGALTLLRGGEDTPATGIRASVETSILLSRPDLQTIALSPDARFLAYVSGNPGEQTLEVLQVATGSVIQVLPPRDQFVDDLRFSPDGNFLYFREDDPEKPGYRSLFVVPSLGGSPTRKVFDVDTRISFAPDGERAAFWRGNPLQKESLLVSFDLASGQETILFTLKYPAEFQGYPAWSPDGDRLAVCRWDDTSDALARILIIDVRSGETAPLGGALTGAPSLEWLPDGTGLVFAGHVAWETGQIWHLSYPQGELSRLTNESAHYREVQVTEDGTALAGVRASRVSNLWVKPMPDGDPKPLTFNSGSAYEVMSAVWVNEEEMVYQQTQESNSYFWSMRRDGTGNRQITSSTGELTWHEKPRLVPGTRSMLFVQGDGLMSQVFRLNLDSGETVQLTHGSSTWLSESQVLPADGSFQVWRSDSSQVLWRVPVEGGEPIRLASCNGVVGTSPDGRFVLVHRYEETDGTGVRMHLVIPVEGGEPVARLKLPPYRSAAWTLDGQAVSFAGVVNGVQGIYRQPLTGGEPSLITRVDAGQIQQHGWLGDGSLVVFRLLKDQTANLWAAPGDGGPPRPLTQFQTGRVFGFRPSPNGASLAFNYGSVSGDVVMIRGFR